MGGFNERAGAGGITSEGGDGEDVADGGDVGVVHRLVGLGLDGEADFRIVGEHGVEGFDEPVEGLPGAFSFAKVGALPREPQDEDVGAEFAGDVYGLQAAVNGVAAVGGVVGGVGAIHGARGKPQARRDHLGDDALAIEPPFQLASLGEHLRVGLRINVGHGVVVVKHHGVEAEFLQLAELPVEGLRWARLGAVGIAAFAPVPRACAKAVGV